MAETGGGISSSLHRVHWGRSALDWPEDIWHKWHWHTPICLYQANMLACISSFWRSQAFSLLGSPEFSGIFNHAESITVVALNSYIGKTPSKEMTYQVCYDTLWTRSWWIQEGLLVLRSSQETFHNHLTSKWHLCSCFSGGSSLGAVCHEPEAFIN